MAVTVVRTGSVDTSSFLTNASASNTYALKTSPEFNEDISIQGSVPDLTFINSSGSVVSRMNVLAAGVLGEAEFNIVANEANPYKTSRIVLYGSGAQVGVNTGELSSIGLTIDSNYPFALISSDIGTMLNVDTSGRVTFPKQPIISGQIGSIASITGAQKIGFDDFWLNQGGISYNATTKRFTVPVAGNYRITMNPFAITGQANTRVLIGVNTDTPTASGHKGHSYRESATYDTMSLNSIVTLAANDYIVFYLYSGGLYNNTSDRFNQFTIELIG